MNNQQPLPLHFKRFLAEKLGIPLEEMKDSFARSIREEMLQHGTPEEITRLLINECSIEIFERKIEELQKRGKC